MQFRFVDSLSMIDAGSWDTLLTDNYPFLSYTFLSALEESGSVSEEAGWSPSHLIGEQGGNLCFAMPLYVKNHSYGEYVFDWQWAQAYEQRGLRYFPKLLSAIPFTPVSGPRFLSSASFDQGLVNQIVEVLGKKCVADQYSSWHMLFPEDSLKQMLDTDAQMHKRNDVQFHWQNQNYTNFDDFLSGFRSSKRKQIRRERRKVSEQGIRLVRKSGDDLEIEDWRNFYSCYKATYYKRSGHSGYLNWAFFELIAERMANQVMLVFAVEDKDGLEETIASSLFFYDSENLYGRYWGTMEERDCLHFEACYYQGIDFAIENGLSSFNPGTQGEHKLVRGFEPVETCSFHWIAHPQFSEAIGQYLSRETSGIARYKEAAANYLPFRKDTD